MSNTKLRPRILGVELDAVTLAQALEVITAWLAEPQATAKLVFTPNPEMLVYAHRRSDFRDLLNTADLNVPDGTGAVWFSRGKIPQRVAGTDIVQQLVQTKQRIGCVINPTSLSSKVQIQQLLPDAEVITATETFSSQPALILVALGSPEQEHWISRHRHLAGSRVLMGVGASLDHLTGTQKRAPLLFQYLRLEWLWRLLHQPSRFKRILTATIIFPYLALTQSSNHDWNDQRN